MKITSVNNQLIKDITKLHQKKYRDKEGLFLLEGYHLYEEALKFGNIKYVFSKDDSIKGSNVIYVDNKVMEKLAQTKHNQGVLVVCEKVINNNVTDKVLILEKIQDPGNLGTLLRSALAFGFQTVVLDHTVDLYNDKVIRSTQGNLFRLNILEMGTNDFMSLYPDYHVIGTAMQGDSLSEIKTNHKVAIILGNEGNGVSKEVLDKANQIVTIKTEIESLNVAVAGSIIMHSISQNN
jgi:TrmH family RNA methyltransferase